MPASTPKAFDGPLKGLRILDAGTMIGGPFACTLAADHGADVIKIEKPGPGRPDPPADAARTASRSGGR